MMGLRSRLGFALYLYMIVLVGLFMGMNQGYQAESVHNTSIVYEQGSLTVGDSHTELNTSVEDPPKDSSLEGTIQKGITDFVEELLHVSFVMAFGVADYTATLAFYISPIVPKFVASGVLNIASLVPVGIGGYTVLTRASEI